MDIEPGDRKVIEPVITMGTIQIESLLWRSSEDT